MNLGRFSLRCQIERKIMSFFETKLPGNYGGRKRFNQRIELIHRTIIAISSFLDIFLDII